MAGKTKTVLTVLQNPDGVLAACFAPDKNPCVLSHPDGGFLRKDADFFAIIAALLPAWMREKAVRDRAKAPASCKHVLHRFMGCANWRKAQAAKAGK